MKIEKMPSISVTFFNPDRSLLGIDCELLTMCDGVNPDKSLIISRYICFSLGFIIVTLNINVKLKGDN